MTRIARATDTATGFFAGTRIATPGGLCPVETLERGDKVITLDGGARPVLWAGVVTLTPGSAERPVLIPEGALDNDAEFVVAPDQRLLWTGWQAELLFGSNEVLVEARDLIGMNGIDWLYADGAVELWQVVLADGELILADGTWSETHAADDALLARLDDETAEALAEIADGMAAMAPRPVLAADEAKVLRSYGAYRRREAEIVRAPMHLRLVA